jgi:hypothetical protein
LSPRLALNILLVDTLSSSQITHAGAQASSRATWRPGTDEQQQRRIGARANAPASLRQPAQVSEIPDPHVRPPVPRQCKGDHDMASRPEIKVKKSEPDETVQEAPNQKAKKEAGNYRLQVDRQTKAFYMTEEAAETAGLVIKKGHPVVQVSIYNSAEGVNKIIELPK